jgi:hypothetical protein
MSPSSASIRSMRARSSSWLAWPRPAAMLIQTPTARSATVPELESKKRSISSSRSANGSDVGAA